ncbi:MAG TPA: tRNA (adenosine(37)-N6)-threonylcarbamoyltransferase complex dimerization subunit type 1 TsaB [Candidatus Saccharimonadales bacterium]|jgi:tRNA threonylcarbamoyladenosine biosynthesis protein TsaB
MIILTIRTDKPEAEIGLYEDTRQLASQTWMAHRQLAETLHDTVRHMLSAHSYNLNDIDAIACYAGPGSFTGLRIGLTVANALSYALHAPIIATSGDEWRSDAITRLLAGETDGIAMPVYGTEVHITQPKG